MVVRERTGRVRYVAFRVVAPRPLARGDFLAALRQASADRPDAPRPRLVLFDGRRGLVRCRHTAKDATIALLRGLREVGDQALVVETLGTSGTIRRARKKYLS
jgi:ribonuclease P/MRP protein subunit POP5